MSKALVLFSGGLDSTTCLAMAVNRYSAENVIALSLSYGQRHDKEIRCARELAKFYKVEHLEYDVSKIFESSGCSLLKKNDTAVPEGSYSEQLDGKKEPVSTYVPYRNGLFISIAASIALSKGCSMIYYGAHKDDAAGSAYPDCSEKFNRFIGDAIYEGTGHAVRVIAPFINKNKADIVAAGLKLGVPYEKTWSCYKGGGKPCGKCGTCIDRIKAFKINGMEDPIYD